MADPNVLPGSRCAEARQRNSSRRIKRNGRERVASTDRTLVRPGLSARVEVANVKRLSAAASDERAVADDVHDVHVVALRAGPRLPSAVVVNFDLERHPDVFADDFAGDSGRTEHVVTDVV